MLQKKIQLLVLLLGSFVVHAQENFEYTFEYTWKKRSMNMPELYTDRLKLRLLEMQALLHFLCISTNCIRIQAACDPENKASAKVLQKAGMEYEGLLRNYSCVHKKPANRCMYALIPE